MIICIMKSADAPRDDYRRQEMLDVAQRLDVHGKAEP